MNDLSQNHVIKFFNVSKRKDGMSANFKAKGVSGAVTYAVKIAVDLETCGLIGDEEIPAIIKTTASAAEREMQHIGKCLAYVEADKS